MTDWAVVWLGVMAASLVVMAAIQIGLIIIGIRLARQMATAVEELRREVGPLVEKVHRIADDAARATSLAALQVERVDQLLSATSVRVEQAVNIIQNAMGGPVRQGAAIFMALRAVLGAFRQWQRRDRPGRDDDDALFVG